MNKPLLTVLISFVIGAGVGYYTAHKVREHSIKDLEAEIADKWAVIDSLRAKVTRDSIKIDAQEKKLAAVRDSAAKAIKYWQTKADSAINAADDIPPVADSTATELEELLDPHEYALFQKYVSLRDMESQLLRFAIFAKDSVIFEQRRTIAQQDILLDQYRETVPDMHRTIAEQAEMIEYWKEASKRDWWEMPQFTVPTTIGLTLGGVYLVGKATDKI